MYELKDADRNEHKRAECASWKVEIETRMCLNVPVEKRGLKEMSMSPECANYESQIETSAGAERASWKAWIKMSTSPTCAN